MEIKQTFVLLALFLILMTICILDFLVKKSSQREEADNLISLAMSLMRALRWAPSDEARRHRLERVNSLLKKSATMIDDSNCNEYLDAVSRYHEIKSQLK